VIAFWQDPLPAQAGSDFGNVQQLHPVGLAALGLLMFATLVLPRRWNTWPLVLLLCFIPAGQRFVIATLDFPFLRLLLLATWTRLILRNELRQFSFNRLDKSLLAWAGAAILTATIYYGTIGAFVNRSGMVFDTLAAYFFFRHRITSLRDLSTIAGQFLISSFAVMFFFVVENRTQRNLFHVFGGVPEFTDIRDGRLRCQGAFAHPILAGCFFACLLPLYAIRGFVTQRWGQVAMGTFAALVIVVLCASSTPVVAVLVGIAAACSIALRGALRPLRWLAIGGLLGLHFFMKQPVWHLLARIDIAGGSTGYHRYHLVDKFFAFFGEWALLGTRSTAHWGFGLQDVTNQYVAEGVEGGLLRLILFVSAILFAFAGISRALRMPGLSRSGRLVAWALGTLLVMHCMNFIAVSYFEQIVTLWFLSLAAIGSLTPVPGRVDLRQPRPWYVAAAPA
jgi:hypothetical protein